MPQGGRDSILSFVSPQQKVAEPVSEYVRFLISRWEADGRRLYVLAKLAGLAKSMPSQIKAGTSDVGFYSAERLAGPLGYRNLPSLVEAAYVWWNSADRTKKPEAPEMRAQIPAPPNLRAVAAERGYTDVEVETAAMVAEMAGRDASALPPNKAEELLQRARLFIQDSARSVEEIRNAPTTRPKKLAK